ncbi:MAG: redox-regulated ATPase YchF, partial [Candidatus Korarchaeota archaeon]|nr:redox-regulated ATPase YchF [Candidatus Korarchaeota archaeon]
VGVVGKTNVGKSTFFYAATLVPVEVSNRPFTTIRPNVGIAYLRKRCVHEEFGVQCNPRNSLCIRGYRMIPVRMLDVAGLIPGAHRGRGLGNKFLDDLRQADVLIHVVDASGSTDPEGNPVPPGTHNPVEDVLLIEREVDEWFHRILSSDWGRFARTVDTGGEKVEDALARRLSGLSIRKEHVVAALRETGLGSQKLSSWRDEELRAFASALRRISKPMVIAANKADLPSAEDVIREMRRELRGRIIVPTSAASELALRKAALKKVVEYLPGDPDFKILDESALTRRQREALEYIRRHVLEKWGSTGIQEALNRAFFELLDMIAVDPVEDAGRLTDHDGNVLPDVFLVRRGTTARDLAYMIHTDLGRTFLYAVDARTKTRLGEDYVLRDDDVVKIVAAKAR